MAWGIAIVRNRLQEIVSQLRCQLSRIWIRLLAFNVLLVFLPAIGLFYFQVYERELLESQEQSMVQQGRVLAAALAGGKDLAEEAPLILERVYPETISRLRVIDRDRFILADSSRAGTQPELVPGPRDPAVSDSWLYKVGQTLFNLVTRNPLSQQESVPEPTYNPLEASEVDQALQPGRFGG